MTAARKPGRHAASRRRPIRLAWLWLLAGLAGLWAALAKVNGLSDEDRGVTVWAAGIAEDVKQHPGIALADQADSGREHGPAAPARRPQLLTVARARTVAIIRAIPVDAIPWLQHGHGYSDTTGTFAAISQEPPVLRAHESVSLTRAEVAGGLAAQQVKEWGP